MTQNVQFNCFLFVYFCFVLVWFHQLSPYWLISVVLSECVFKQPIYKSFLFRIEFLIIYMQPLENCLKAFQYIASCFVLQQGSEISQCTDSSSAHKRLIKPPSFALKIKSTLIWCKVCYCPRTEIISLSAHKRWVTRINQTLIHRIGQHGEEDKFTGAKCVICCQSLYAWWQCCAGFWSRTLGSVLLQLLDYNDILTPADSRGSTIPLISKLPQAYQLSAWGVCCPEHKY